MGLKKIKPKHREIMRRMITCQDTEEISLELRVSKEYLGMLTRDSLFVETLTEMEGEAHGLWLTGRMKAMDILEDHASAAARLCVDAMGGLVDTLGEDGLVGKEVVPLGKRLSSAWDVLDRTGHKGIDKSVVAHVTLQDMIIEAYKLRSNGGDDSTKGARKVTALPERAESKELAG